MIYRLKIKEITFKLYGNRSTIGIWVYSDKYEFTFIHFLCKHFIKFEVECKKFRIVIEIEDFIIDIHSMTNKKYKNIKI